MDKIKAIRYNSWFNRIVISGEPGSESVGYRIEHFRGPDHSYRVRELVQYVLSNVTEFGILRVRDGDNWYSLTYKQSKIIGSTGDWTHILLKDVTICTASGGFGTVDYLATV